VIKARVPKQGEDGRDENAQDRHAKDHRHQHFQKMPNEVVPLFPINARRCHGFVPSTTH
jgi:hypothetical protein